MIPMWQSHKVVTADMVTGVSVAFDATGPDGPADVYKWHLACGVSVTASKELRGRVPATNEPPHSPVGGYYVRYEDGYESWSPAGAFESGYKRFL